MKVQNIWRWPTDVEVSSVGVLPCHTSDTNRGRSWGEGAGFERSPPPPGPQCRIFNMETKAGSPLAPWPPIRLEDFSCPPLSKVLHPPLSKLKLLYQTHQMEVVHCLSSPVVNPSVWIIESAVFAASVSPGPFVFLSI